MSEEFRKSIRLVRLRSTWGDYLTANMNHDSIEFCKPDSNGILPKNAEWRMKPEADAFCFESIYGLLLSCSLFSYFSGIKKAKQRLWNGKHNTLIGNPRQHWYLNFDYEVSKEEFRVKIQLVKDMATTSFLVAYKDGAYLVDSTSRNSLFWILEVVQTPNCKTKPKMNQLQPEVPSIEYSHQDTTQGNNQLKPKSEPIQKMSSEPQAELLQPKPESLLQLKPEVRLYYAQQINFNFSDAQVGMGPVFLVDRDAVRGDFCYYNSGHNVNGSGTQNNGDVCQ